MNSWVNINLCTESGSPLFFYTHTFCDYGLNVCIYVFLQWSMPDARRTSLNCSSSNNDSMWKVHIRMCKRLMLAIKIRLRMNNLK